MGKSKDRLEEEKNMFDQAKNILVRIGAISECPNHSNEYIDNQSLDNDEIYTQATLIYEKEQNYDKSKIKKFHEKIKNVIDNCPDECFLCKSNEEE